MELDGGHRQAAVLHRLCHSALAPGGAAEAIAQTVHRLVVGAVDQDAAAPQPVEQAARRGTNGMPQVELPDGYYYIDGADAKTVVIKPDTSPLPV